MSTELSNGIYFHHDASEYQSVASDTKFLKGQDCQLNTTKLVTPRSLFEVRQPPGTTESQRSKGLFALSFAAAGGSKKASTVRGQGCEVYKHRGARKNDSYTGRGRTCGLYSRFRLVFAIREGDIVRIYVYKSLHLCNQISTCGAIGLHNDTCCVYTEGCICRCCCGCASQSFCVSLKILIKKPNISNVISLRQVRTHRK